MDHNNIPCDSCHIFVTWLQLVGFWADTQQYENLGSYPFSNVSRAESKHEGHFVISTEHCGMPLAFAAHIDIPGYVEHCNDYVMTTDGSTLHKVY